MPSFWIWCSNTFSVNGDAAMSALWWPLKILNDFLNAFIFLEPWISEPSLVELSRRERSISPTRCPRFWLCKRRSWDIHAHTRRCWSLELPVWNSYGLLQMSNSNRVAAHCCIRRTHCATLRLQRVWSRAVTLWFVNILWALCTSKEACKCNVAVYYRNDYIEQQQRIQPPVEPLGVWNQDDHAMECRCEKVDVFNVMRRLLYVLILRRVRPDNCPYN